MQKESCSNPFALSVFDDLLELVGPIVQRDDLLSKVDFSMMENIDHEFQIKDLTFFAEASILDKILVEKKKINASDVTAILSTYGTSTKLVFYFLESMNKMLIPILKQAESMSTQLERAEKEVEKIPDSDFRKPMMKKYIDNLRNEFFMYRICLEDDERVSVVNNFYFKFLNLLIEKMQTGACVPGYYITDYIEFQTFFANIKKGYFSQFGVRNFSLYLNLLDVILSEKFKNSNRYIKAKYLDLLFTFNIIEKGDIVNVLKDHLGSHERIVNFEKSMLAFYSEIEFMTDTGGVSQMKHRYRFFITKFLLKALQLPEYSNALLSIIDSTEVSSYVGHLISDLNYFLDDAFEKLKKIYHLQTSGNHDLNSVINQQQQQNEDENQQTTDNESIPALTEQVKGLFKFGRSQLALMEKLAMIAPKIFSTEEWANKVAQTINYYASKMCSKSYKSYKVADISKINLKPLEFITKLIYIYVGMSQIEAVKTAILKDERSFSSDNLIDLGRTAFMKALVPPDVLKKFETLISELNDMKIDKDAMEKILGDIPDEFQCGFTYELMGDPVTLPSSKTVIDRNSIKQHITLNGEFDPFTKAKLTLDMLIEMPDLKAKIYFWLKEKKELYFKTHGSKKVEIGSLKKSELDVEDIYSSEADVKSEKSNFFGQFD